MENLEFVPIANWTEYHGIEKSLNTSSVIQLTQDFHGVPVGLLIIGIPLHILGIIQQGFIVIYERNEMDPMKRSLTNQIISTHMLWALNLSIVTILRSFICLLINDLPLFVLIPMEYLMVTYTIALTLIYIVASFSEYFSRLILKRTPNYDHDFLATGFQAAIFGLAFYLGALQTFSLFSVKEVEEQPLLIPSILVFILSMITLTFGLHKLFNWCQTFKIRQNTVSVVSVKAWTPTPRPSNLVVLQVENLPLNVQLNTERFNPDVSTDHTYNLMNAVCSSIFFVLLLTYSRKEDVTGFHGYIYNLWSCFALPFIFCTVSPKLRGFIIKSLVHCSSH